MTKSVLITTENSEHVDTARGLPEDPHHTHGTKDAEKTHKDKTKPHRLSPSRIVGVERTLSCMNVTLKEHFAVLPEVASITGVGDNPNVGSTHGTSKHDAWHCDP